MTFNYLLQKSFVLALFVSFSLFITSCSDDPVKGCTDPLAETYNPDAEESDANSCVYARDKFVGNYAGSLVCPGALGSFIDNPSYNFSIEESASGTVNDLSINLVVFGVPTKLAATVNGDLLTIDQTLENIPFNVPPLGDVIVNIVASGSASVSGNNLTGNVIIEIIIVANGATVAKDTCPITGIKS